VGVSENLCQCPADEFDIVDYEHCLGHLEVLFW
jgi:hypothetical protein